MSSKFHVQDYSQDEQHSKGQIGAFGGNILEMARKTFDFSETQLTQILNVSSRKCFLMIRSTHIPIGKRLWQPQWLSYRVQHLFSVPSSHGSLHQQFQVMQAQPRPYENWLSDERVSVRACEKAWAYMRVCVWLKDRAVKKGRVGVFVCHWMFSTLFQQCTRDDCLLGKANPILYTSKEQEGKG